jgi:capsular exopolysaccharide synthesis family protein
MRNEPVAADLKDYLATLRRSSWLIVIVTVAVVGVAFVRASRQTPIFTASAEVLVEQIVMSTPQVTSGPLSIENEARIATSSRVVSVVRRTLAEGGVNPAPTTVEAPTGASTLVFTSESSDPRTAQLTADVYASTYLSERSALFVGEIVVARTELESRIEELTLRIEEKRRALLDADTPNEIDVLGVELETLTSQLLAEQGRLDAIPVPTSIRVGEVLHPAQLPTEPSNRDFGTVGLLGAFLGLSLGIGLALFRDRLARPVTSRPDLEAAAGAPLVAMIPRFRSVDEGKAAFVEDRRSPAADAFNVLAARVLFAMARQSVRTILLTSAQPREGKTTTAVNLAVSLAESGRSVVLVLADRYKPAPAGLFDDDQFDDDQQALSSALSGEIEPLAALRPTAVPNLMVIGNALPAHDAGDLSRTDAMRDIIQGLKRVADVVVIDTTPMLGPSDALTLASFVDAILLVANTQRSTLSRIKECAIELRSVDASILGVVLTGVTRSFHPYQARATYYAAGRSDANGGRRSKWWSDVTGQGAERASDQRPEERIETPGGT